MNTYNYNNTPNFEQDEYGLINKVALVAVLAFIFLFPWGDGIKDGLPALIGIPAIALSGLVFITEGTHKNYSLYHFMVIVLWSWVLISLLWTPEISTGIEVAKRVVQLMLLPFMFTLLFSSKSRMNLAYQAFVLGNIMGSSIIISNYMNGIESQYYNRYGIPNLEPDLLGVMLALSVPVAAYLIQQYQSKLLKILYTISIPMISYAIFLTGTRTATILMMVGIAYWLFSYRKSSIKVKASIFGLFIISVILALSFIPKASLERAVSSGESISKGTLNYRTVIWGASINQWKKSPILGVGLGGLGPVLSKEHVNFAGAHNTYIEFLTENGIIGLIIYVLLLISVLYLMLHCPFQEKVFLFSVFLVITVSQMTQHSHIQKETWFMLTMLAIHAKMYSISKASSQNHAR